MTVTQLIGLAARHGFAVARTGDGVKLCPKQPAAKCPDWLIDKLRERRADIIRWLDRGPDPNPPAPRPAAGPTTCPDCRADVYPAATRADIAQLCERTSCHYLTPELWRGHHGRS